MAPHYMVLLRFELHPTVGRACSFAVAGQCPLISSRAQEWDGGMAFLLRFLVGSRSVLEQCWLRQHCSKIRQQQGSRDLLNVAKQSTCSASQHLRLRLLMLRNLVPKGCGCDKTCRNPRLVVSMLFHVVCSSLC